MNYRKAILIHAYVVPLGIAVLLALILLIGPAQYRASQQSKQEDYLKCEQLNMQLLQAEGKIAGKRKLIDAWKGALQSDFNSTLNNLINTKLETLDGKLGLESSGGRPDGSNSLSLTGGQPATRTRIEFRGGFEPMQETLLVLEGTLPQMQLESMGITEHPNGDGLRYDLTYTVWDKATTAVK